MPRVLIVEDELDLGELLQFNLQREGFEAARVSTGEQALAGLEAFQPDLVVLDLMLPDMPGLQVCRKIRCSDSAKTPLVVLLTARTEEADRVAGFEAGADDYVTKPFSVRELVLRLKAILRRGHSTGVRQTLSLGQIRIEPANHRCFVGTSEVSLTALEFRLLQHLILGAGRVHTREELLEEVWGSDAEQETRTTDTHVMRLREKLGAARDYLKTVRGVGYRLVVPEAANPTPPDAH